MSEVHTFADPVPEVGAVVVGEVSDQGLAQYLIDGRHEGLFADESVKVGGSDKGPEPYELLLMALGSCTSMTLRMYAKRHDMPLERVVITLKHSRQYLDDSIKCEKERRRVETIERVITLRGKLSAEQKQTLMEMAERCPVHQTLSAKVNIVSRLDEQKPIA